MADEVAAPPSLCRWVLMPLLLVLLMAGTVQSETLPTLTLQPLNYFTLPPPPVPSSPTPSPSTSPSPSTLTTAGREREEKEREEALTETEEGEEEEDEEEEEEEDFPLQPQLASHNSSLRVHVGEDATLDCMVLHPANMSVSWLRRKDDMLELLTWDTHLYANDHRYSVAAAAGSGWRRWRLVIGNSVEEDQGQYRCQLATDTPQILTISLHVIVPVVRVVDERGGSVGEKHYKSGSRIELTCLIEQVAFPPHPVTWKRDRATLTYNTSRGGISVKGDAVAGFLVSRLYVADATPADSGTYTCCYNVTCAPVLVHVLAGENSAAMQHDGLPDSSSEAPRSSSSSTSSSSSSSCLLTLSPFLPFLLSTLCIVYSGWTGEISPIFNNSPRSQWQLRARHVNIGSAIFQVIFVSLIFSSNVVACFRSIYLLFQELLDIYSSGNLSLSYYWQRRRSFSVNIKGASDDKR